MKSKNLLQVVCLLSLLGFLFSTNNAKAAVAYDNASTAGSATSSITWSHITTGSDTFLVVGHVADLGVDGTTGITYAGVSLTERLNYGGSGAQCVLYTLASPTSGDNNVVITKKTADNSRGGAITVTGSNGTYDGLTNGTTATRTSDSQTVTSGSTGDMVIDVLCSGTTTAWNANGDNTGRVSGATQFNLSMSTAPGAASVNMSWAIGSGNAVESMGVLNVNLGTQGGGGTPTPKPRRPIIQESQRPLKAEEAIIV